MNKSWIDNTLFSPLIIVCFTLLSIPAIHFNWVKLDLILGHWMWFYSPHSMGQRLWYVLLVIAIVFLGLLVIDKRTINREVSRRLEFISVCCLSVFAFILNMEIFSLGRYGFDELVQIVIHKGRTSFFTDAVSISNIQPFLQNYQDILPTLTHHSQTHGPGAIVTIWAVYRSTTAYFGHVLVGTLEPFLSIDYLHSLAIANIGLANDAVIATALIVGLTIPALASLSIIPLYYLARLYSGKRAAFMSTVLMMTLPGIILFTPQISQVMVLFGVLLIWTFMQGAKSGSLILIAISAAVFLLSLLFGAELLAMLPIIAAIGFFQAPGRARSEPVSISARIKTTVGLLAVFLLATTILMAGLYFLTGFNLPASYRVLLSIDHSYESSRPYAKWVWGNLLEFFVYLGPLTLLLIRKVIVEIRGDVPTGKKRYDYLFWAFAATILCLDIAGINRGEVARLWLFFLPFAALAGASTLSASSSEAGIIKPGNMIYVMFFANLVYAIVLKSTILTIPL